MKLKWLVIMLATFAFVFVQAGFKETSVYADSSSSLPVIPPVVNGVVEVSSPIQLSYIDLHQPDYQSSTIKLMSNLDMTGYSWWAPILNFSGTFDGNGYDISNFTISQPAQEGSNTYLGMFGSTTSTAIIKNLTLSNCNVTGNARNMGALVGRNYGNILHVGIIGGSVHQNGIYFDGYSIFVGGIAGWSIGADSGITSSVRDSYSTSDVSGDGFFDFGFEFGLMGVDNHFKINTSYAAGSLSGKFPYKYGIANIDSVALYFNKDKTTGLIQDSFSFRQLSTQDMLKQSSFVGWDFQNTWSILPGKTYPFLKGMNSITPAVLPPAFQNTVYSQKLQVPASSSAPGDLIWEAISLPPGLSLSNDGTLTGTPTSIADQSFTVVVYSPSTHIVYGSGSISLLINPAPTAPKITPPTVNNIDIVNNLASTADTVTVRALKAGDVIKVYDAPTGGNLLGQSPPAASGETSATVPIAQLGTGAGQVYVCITIKGNLESARTAKAYDAEPVQTTAPLASNITVTNNPTGTPDTVLVNDLTRTSALASPGNKESQDAFDFMKGLGCASGYPDGAHLDDTMTRAQVVTFLVRCMGQGSNAKILAGAAAFSDMAQHWASGDIAIAKSRGWVSGYADGEFHPDQTLTRAELLQMLDNVLGLQVHSNLTWPSRALKPALDAGLITQNDYNDIVNNVNAPASRGTIFFYTNSAFSNIPLPDGKTVYEQNFGLARKPPEKKPDPGTDPATKQTPPPSDFPPGRSGGRHLTLPSVNATVDSVSDVSAQIKLEAAYVDHFYYLVLPSESPPPSVDQIISLKDSAGNTVGAGKSGSGLVPSLQMETQVSLTGLSAYTSYTVYLVGTHANDSANKQVTFTTSIAATAPTVTNVVYASVTDSVYNITALFSNASKLYYVVPDDETPLTPDQVKSFHGARLPLASGSIDVPANSNERTFPVPVPNLYLYNIYVVVEYGGRLSNIKTMDFPSP